MSRFENSKTKKYIEIENYGYIREGELGGSKPKKFEKKDDENNQTTEEKLLGSGFIKVGEAGSVWDFEPNLDIEEKIKTNIDNEEYYLEYANWLEEKGQIALCDLIRINGYEYDNEMDKLYFGVLPFGRSIKKWRFGFVQDFEAVSNCSLSLLESFLNLPVLRFIESFAIRQQDIPELFRFLNTWNGLKSLKKLNIWDEEECGFGNLNMILPNLKHLQFLYLVGTIYEPAEEEVEIKKIDLPELIHFARISPNLTLKELDSITNAFWPKLEALTIGVGFDSEISSKDFIPFLKANNLRSLKYLDIRHFEEIDDLLELMVNSSLLSQLTRLSFYQSNLTSKGAQVLLKNKDKFSHLEVINIQETILTKEDEKRLIAEFASIEPYNSFREEGEEPYIDAIYQETFWEPNEKD